MIVLAGDVGGTNARLALAEVEADTLVVSHEERYPSRDFDGLAPIAAAFLASCGARPERACFGIAGPVVDQRARMPNLTWTIDAHDLARATGIADTRLVNDFAAVGWGIPRLGAADVVTLQEGRRAPRGPIALIGAGTGLGQGFLLWEGTGYRVHGSEGGHATFAARDPLEWGLVQFLLREHDRVSWERVLSGPGLANVYRYLAAAGVAPEQAAVRAEMARDDHAAVVTRHALAGTDALCTRALDLFISAYGAAAGHLAITVLATGGVYVAGGIAPRIVERLAAGGFLASFRAQGRLADLAASLPVHVVMNTDVGLLGAAAAAFAGAES